MQSITDRRRRVGYTALVALVAGIASLCFFTVEAGEFESTIDRCTVLVAEAVEFVWACDSINTNMSAIVPNNPISIFMESMFFRAQTAVQYGPGLK